jgi:hypothetical protein
VNTESVPLTNKPTAAAIRMRSVLFLSYFCLLSATCIRLEGGLLAGAFTPGWSVTWQAQGMYMFGPQQSWVYSDALQLRTAFLTMCIHM